jgi:TPR repeat protein
MLYVRGDRVARSLDRALTFLRSACKASDAAGCTALGDTLKEAQGAAAQAEVLVSWQAACAEHDALGCHRLAGLYDDGAGVPADPKRAEVLYEDACDRGAGLACNVLGKRAEKDAARSAKLYARAVKLLSAECSAGAARSCGQLGWSEEHGLGTVANAAQATRSYERGCDGNDGPSCYNLAATRNRASAKDPSVTELFARACKLGVAEACRYEADDPRQTCEAMRERGELKEGVSLEDCERALGE